VSFVQNKCDLPSTGRKLKKQITIKIDSDTIDYFKEMAKRSGMPYQTLINLYLSDCAANNRQLKMTWD